MTVLTAIGIINCLGSTAPQVYANLISAHTSGIQPTHDLLTEEICLAGRVTDNLPDIPENLGNYNARFFSLTLAACEQIAQKLDSLKSKYCASRIGVVLGSSTSGIHSGEESYTSYRESGSFPEQYHYVQQEMGAVSEFVAHYFGLKGPAYTVSTACTSGAKSLIAARRLLQAGVCDAVITGGVDSLCKLTVRGFHSLGLVSRAHTNPFSRNREGLNLGEGACLFVMEKEGQGVRLLGTGESSDAFHMSAPHPEGRGAIAALRQCLDSAGITPEEVAYINLHGTGTAHNDQAEAMAIATTLGLDIPVSSTKPLTGHLLGAAGATEAGFCYLILKNSTGSLSLPPHVWDGESDPDLPRLRFVERGTPSCYAEKGAILSTSFAFGGSNCALLFAPDTSQPSH